MNLLKILLAALFSYALALPLLAAEATQVDGAENVTEVQQNDGDNVVLGDSATGSENDVEEDSEEDSPSRFIPTEQISQDLGVSFPADI